MIGQRIKQIRQEKKLTQDELAKQLGISRQAICMWEANKRELRVSTLHRVGQLLGVSIDELLRFEKGATTKRRGDMAKKPTAKALRVDFELLAPDAKKVAVTGNFSSWDASGVSMKKIKGGVWKASVSLEPGKYEYKFIVDGQWMNDPSNNNTVKNQFGTLNSVKDVNV